MRQNILEKLDQYVEANIGTLDRSYNHSSELGWVFTCPRRLELLRLLPALEKPLDMDTKRFFHERKLQEAVIVDELKKAGLNVSSHGEGKKTMLAKDYEIVTELDCIYNDSVPLEIKTCSPQVFPIVKQMKTAKDLMNSNVFHLRNYPAQLWTQVMTTKGPWGMWLFKNVSDGEKHIIETDAGEGATYMEGALEKIKDVNKNIELSLPSNAVENEGCKRCGFYGVLCFKEEAKDSTDVTILSNQELEEALIRWHELSNLIEPAEKFIKEYEDLDKQIKMMCRGMNVRVGDFRVRSKGYEYTIYNIPDDIKEQYVAKERRFRAKIEFLGGGF
jgi:hypothetical protein